MRRSEYQRVSRPLVASDTIEQFGTRWLAHKQGELKFSAYDDYRKLFVRWVRPRIGGVPLAALRTRDVEALLFDVAASTPAQARKVRILLSSMLNDAKRWDLVPDQWQNPVRLARLPRAARERNGIRGVTEVPTEAEAQRVSHFMASYSEMPLIAAYAGLRWGEIAALRGTDIDPSKREVMVERALVRDRITTPKSKASERTVVYAREIEGLMQALAEKGKKPLFTTARGGYLNYSNWRRKVWKPACDAAGFKWRFHDLRHTYATLLIHRGLPVSSVARMLGHANSDITLRVYTGYFSSIGDEVRAAI